jgi:hypothetical protein
VATEQDRVLDANVETRAEAGTSSWWSPNRTVQFPKPEHSVSSVSGQKMPSRTTALGTALIPHWCPLGLTPNQRRRIQWMRAQKMREEAAEKERDDLYEQHPVDDLNEARVEGEGGD